MKKLQASNDPTKYALVDDNVAEIIQDMGLKFSIDKRDNKGYFRSTTEIKLPYMKKRKRLQLHQFVYIIKTGEEPSSTVDHADIDKSNNQFSNLRLASRREQSQHRTKQKNNTSNYIGVSHQHNKNKNGYRDYWRASIKNKNGIIESKTFHYTENGKQHAAMWLDTKAIEYFGEFAILNFPMHHC